MKEQELYRDLIFPFVKGNELKEMIVSFIKKDGTARVMKCKYGVRKEDSKGMNYDAEAKGLISGNSTSRSRNGPAGPDRS